MVTAEITVIPVGTQTPSVGEFVAHADKILENYPGIKSKLTAMGTELECDDISTLFEVMKEMHTASFNNKAQRVYSIIKIDDRKDKEASLESKVRSVEEKLQTL